MYSTNVAKQPVVSRDELHGLATCTMIAAAGADDAVQHSPVCPGQFATRIKLLIAGPAAAAAQAQGR